MPVDFSIKQVPDEVADRLRERARRHHRSLQGELRAILEQAADAATPLTVADVVSWTARVGLSTPGDGTETVRAMRDARGERVRRAASRRGRNGRRG